MKRSALWVLALVLTSGPALAQKIYIDYDKDYDIGAVGTFAWKFTPETSVQGANPLLHARIVNGIEYYLALAGSRENTGNPDVYVTYHTSTKEEVRVDTNYSGYGYPARWGYYGRYAHPGYGTVSASTTVSTYEKGTLVVDIWDAKSNKLVWRGMAANITVTDSPTKMEQRIDKALKKMVATWQKMKAKDADKAAG